MDRQRKLSDNRGSVLGCYSSALLSAIYMGAGQIASGQWRKGLFLMLFETFVVIPNIPLLLRCLKGLVTLGETPMVDHSLFMMIHGILAVIALVFVVAFYLMNIRDAYRCGLVMENGGKQKGWKASLRSMLDRGFPYLILAPGILCLIFFTLLPMAFNIWV